jgi:hypothetical protein
LVTSTAASAVADRVDRLDGPLDPPSRATHDLRHQICRQGVVREWIADSRIEFDQEAATDPLNAAHLMDAVGNKAAACEISEIKVAVPRPGLT